ncbi:MFS transporter [Georgenia sp. SYP-B2076]|uniref:MFS transporter n=1 Tax=Georgenia sp. SYP-B2076 TaxID=2495881 RepID=UPI000F8DDEF1|nr:MFS transporter [Georgenia sp. SYP-B2076]
MARPRATGGGDSDGATLLTRDFLTLTAAELAYFTAFGLTVPIVPLFARGPLGAGPAGVGLAVGVFSATALVLRPLAGRLSDRRGRRPLLVGGGALYAVVTAAHLLAGELWVLVGLRVLLGVAEALFFVAATAALTDLAPPKRLGEALSYNSLALYLGISAGPALGELLLAVGGFRLAWLGGAFLAVVAVMVVLRLPETASPQRDTTDLPLIHRAVLAPGFAFCAGLAAAAGFLTFAALHAREVGLSSSGAVLAVYGLVVVGCRVAFAPLADRYPALWSGAAALACTAAGLAVMAAVRSPAGLVAGTAVLAVGVAFLTPAFVRAIMSSVEPRLRGGAAGTFSMFVDLGLGGGPLLLGLVADAAGIPATFAVGGAAAGSAALATALLARLRGAREATAA